MRVIKNYRIILLFDNNRQVSTNFLSTVVYIKKRGIKNEYRRNNKYIKRRRK